MKPMKPRLILGVSLLALGACAPTTTQAPAEPPAFVKEFVQYMEGPRRSLREDVELLLKPIQEMNLEVLWGVKQEPSIWDRVLAKPPLPSLNRCLYAEKDVSDLFVLSTYLAKRNDPLTAEAWLKDQEARAKWVKIYGDFTLGEQVLLKGETIYADFVHNGRTETLTIPLMENPNWTAARATLAYLKGERTKPQRWQYVPEVEVLYRFLGKKLEEYLNNPPSLWDRYCPWVSMSAGSSAFLSDRTSLSGMLFRIALDTSKRP